MELAFAPTGQFLGGFKRLFKAIFLCAGPIYFVRVIKWVIFFLFKKKYRLVQRVLLFWLNQVLFFFRSSDICICIVHSCFTVTENSKISETSADGFPLQSIEWKTEPHRFFFCFIFNFNYAGFYCGSREILWWSKAIWQLKKEKEKKRTFHTITWENLCFKKTMSLFYFFIWWYCRRDFWFLVEEGFLVVLFC